jgi:CubicO group peptidase (beta-lactamase class C family)
MRWTAPVMLLGTACTPGASSTVRALAPDRPHMRPVTEFLDSSVAAGAAPGAVLGVSSARVRFIYGTGQLGADQPARPGEESVYDLASLTKVVGLVPAAMLAVDEGQLDLDAPVHRYLPAFTGGEKSRVTVRMLLAHTGGLPAWRPLFREVHSRAEAFALADTTPLESSPGSTAAYSDLGAIILTQILETIYHERLDSLLERRLLGPLGMGSTGYLPSAELRDRIAPTELDPWRGRVLQGEVHDENAAIMDGVSGHAGLFSSAGDLLTYGEWLIDEWYGAPSALPQVRRSTLREFTRRENLVPGSSRALGWDTPSGEGSAGHLLSEASFGHTGFTGTSLWIDPTRRLVIVLLSNRVNPTRSNPRWSPVRGAIADLVITTLFKDAR